MCAACSRREPVAAQPRNHDDADSHSRGLQRSHRGHGLVGGAGLAQPTTQLVVAGFEPQIGPPQSPPHQFTPLVVAFPLRREHIHKRVNPSPLEQARRLEGVKPFAQAGHRSDERVGIGKKDRPAQRQRRSEERPDGRQVRHELAGPLHREATVAVEITEQAGVVRATGGALHHQRTVLVRGQNADGRIRSRRTRRASAASAT